MQKTQKIVRKAAALFLCLVLFAALCTSAFAQEVTVSTTLTNSYFETLTSSGRWSRIGTPLHTINETGQVAYCLQTDYRSPEGSGYTSINGSDYYDQTTLNGLQAILENGYPVATGGYNDDEARYATANAIRFWLAERGCEGVPGWMDYSRFPQFLKGAPGYEGLFDWAIFLLNQARNQNVQNASIELSPSDLTLTQEGSYFVGQTTVTLHNCNSYSVDNYTLPFGASVEGVTGNSGDVLTIKIDPEYFTERDLTIAFDGDGVGGEAALLFFSPYNSGEQRVVAYDVNAYGQNTSAWLNIHVPEPAPSGDIKIKKVDADTGEAIPGVVFALGDSSEQQVRSAVTDSSGYALFEDLPLGEYFYVEESAPEGYIVDGSKHYVTISSNHQVVSLTVENKYEKPTGDLNIHKVDEDTGKSLAGVRYELRTSTGGLKGQKTTKSDGYVRFTNLELGEYTYQEIRAPENYIIDDTVYHVTISQRGQTITKEHTNKYVEPTGNFQIHKIDADTGKSLAGVRYELRTSTGGLKGQKTTKSDGYVHFNDLSFGEYTYKELSAPEGYIVDDTVYHVTISEKGTTITKEHSNKYVPPVAELRIHKVDNTTWEDLPGATYELRDSSGKKIAAKTTDSSGYVYFKDLPLGEYSYVETSAPDGYILDETVHKISLTKSGQVFTDERENEKKPPECSISVHKCDPKGKNLKGVVFELFASEDNGKTFKSIATAETDRSGSVSFKNLSAEPTYRLVETKTLPGMSLLTQPVFEGKIDGVKNPDLSFTVNNCAITALPFTGGSGFNYIPIGMLVLCTGFYFIQKLKRRITNEENC